MNYKKMLPVQQKKKDQGISEDEMKTSRVQRRKKLDPKKWASKWLKDSGGLPTRVFILNNDEQWKYAKPCALCGDTYGAAYLKSDGQWYGPCCEWKVVSKNLLEVIRNQEFPVVLVKNWKWELRKFKIKRWWFNFTQQDRRIPKIIESEVTVSDTTENIGLGESVQETGQKES